VGYLHNGLQGVLPFNSAKGGWRIQILLGSQNIRVTHMRKEEANQESEGELLFLSLKSLSFSLSLLIPLSVFLSRLYPCLVVVSCSFALILFVHADLYGPFSFDWNVDFVLDTDVTTLKEMEVRHPFVCIGVEPVCRCRW
jgi:hypothetical protein